MTDLVTGIDGLGRCPWGASTPEYVSYHDTEWGRPVGDDDRIYEKLCLEGFQSGLSWLTILRKRDGFRRAFSEFDAEAVAGFGDAEVERLVADASIVRHRGKILAAIGNARATVSLRERGGSLAAVVWRYEPKPAKAPVRVSDLVAVTDASKALSKELVRLGFRFVGPTTVHSAMQSLGLVNDHLRGCAFREPCTADRASFTVPA